MDPFSRLPFPVTLHIAKAVPDLLSLHSLRCASPVFSDLLQDARLAVEIVNDVINNDLATLTRDVVRLTCLVVAHPPASWDDLLGLCVIAERDWSPLPEIPAEAVRRLLALAKAVHAAAYRCLDASLARCAAAQPRRPADPTLVWRRDRCWLHSPDDSYKAMPPIADEPVPVEGSAKTMPLWWVEEQRALHGAWQLATFSVMQADATLDITRKGPLYIWRKLSRGFRKYVFSQNPYLETIVDDDEGNDALYFNNYLEYGLVELDEDENEEAERDDPHTPTDESVDTFTNSRRRLSDVFPTEGAQPYHYTDQILAMPDNWDPGYSGTGRSDWGIWKLVSYKRDFYSYLRHTECRPFRALGFYLWEQPRMLALGFCSSHATIQTRFKGSGKIAKYSDIYTWRSLLTPEQVAVLEERQKQIWERGH